MYKLDKYVFETKLCTRNYFCFNLLNFNYFILDTSFLTTKIDCLDEETKKKLFELGFLSQLKEKSLFRKNKNEWEKFYYLYSISYSGKALLTQNKRLRKIRQSI